MKTALFIFLLVMSLGCVGAFAQGTTGTTSITTTTNYVFPPVGLASGGTIAVNLVNIAPASTASNATAPACTGTVTFSSAAGTVIGKASSFTTVGTNTIETITLPATGTSRVEILTSVQQTTTRPSTAPCSLVY